MLKVEPVRLIDAADGGVDVVCTPSVVRRMSQSSDFWGSQFVLDPKRDPPLPTNGFEGNEK